MRSRMEDKRWVLAVLLCILPAWEVHGWLPSSTKHESRNLLKFALFGHSDERRSGDGSGSALERNNGDGEFSRSQFWSRASWMIAATTTSLVIGDESSFLTPTSSVVANAMVTDRKTGIALPELGEIEAAVPKDWTNDDVDNPFDDESAARFGRLDSSPDKVFYADPRFVEHVDEQAVQLMTDYITNEAILRDGSHSVLDLCSSWTSHIDLPAGNNLQRVSGLGMNEKELSRNKVLDDWVVRDLNEKPVLPFEDASFDTVLCQLSVDYLTRPSDVLREVGRVLRTEGKVHIIFSNRLFLSKAIALWTGADDIDHVYTVASYLHFCNGGFQEIQAKDLSARKGRDKRIVGDPLYVVTAKKLVPNAAF